MRKKLGTVGLLALCVGWLSSGKAAEDTQSGAKPAMASAATPATNPALTPAALAEYRAALKEGRALSRKKNAAGAMQAFQRALSAKPDDAAALSELGLAARATKDLTQAERVTRQAVTVAAGALKAASLYNLALILTDKGDKKGAVEALKQSYAARSNQLVLRRLRALDPAAAAVATAPSPPSILKMAGPFPTLSAFADGKSSDSDCRPDKGEEVIRIKPVKSPFLEARVFPLGTGCGSTDYGQEKKYYVAVRLKAGWYVSEKELVEILFGTHLEEKIEFLETVVRDVLPGGAPEVLIRYHVESSNVSRHSEEGDDDASENEDLVLVGIGPSGVPSYTSPLSLSLQTRAPKAEAGKVTYKVKYLPDGLELSNKDLAGHKLPIAFL